MQPAENKDYSRDVILRLSPTRNTIIVEEQKPGGIAAYREIDPLELYYVINQSYRTIDRIKRTAIENLAEMYAYSDQFRV